MNPNPDSFWIETLIREVATYLVPAVFLVILIVNLF